MSTSRYRLGVDVGGTFTDMVLRDASAAVRIYKAPSVPAGSCRHSPMPR